MQEFDQAINHYIDLALESEKATYSSQLESFDAYAEKFRKKLSEYLHSTKEHFLHGYELLLSELEKSKVDMTPFVFDFRKLSEVDSVEKLVQYWSEGRELYELFGYTPKELIALYNAAHTIVERGHIEDGYEAYLFIVTIAPHFREAWLNFGFTCCELSDYLSGIEAYASALDLDPTKADAYLCIKDAYLKLANEESASKACQLGIEYALEHKHEPWAEELLSKLS